MATYELVDMPGTPVLIVGGLGFIGSNLAHRLIGLHAEVTILDACLEPYGWNVANIKEIQDTVTFVRGDVRDAETMRKQIQGKALVFNCAAQVSHTISIGNPFLDLDINCRGVLTLLETVRQYNQHAKIVYASTRGVIGRLQYSPADESHATEPVDINGINKLAAEKYHVLYHRIHKIKTTSLRINNTYGERGQMRHDDYGVVNWFIRRALQGEPIVIHGDGFQTRDYNYVGDVVDALILAGQREEANGEVFLLGSGKATRFIDLLELIMRFVGREFHVTKIPRPEDREAIEIGNFLVSFAKIERALGWHPRTDLETGLRRTIEYYRHRLSKYI